MRPTLVCQLYQKWLDKFHLQYVFNIPPPVQGSESTQTSSPHFIPHVGAFSLKKTLFQHL